ncbi:MAG: chemotaxis response regulator protein-glutamate methylesterase [Vicinamibacteria bacterium]|nr:chemotaxis response regulator protein-glutamate methylesterase [Vicinamibacteria bacterium]
MVVDDSAVVRQTLGAILSQAGGMDVVTAADPVIALAKLGRERPDVIVLDLEMPRMDGLTFLRRLMSEDPLPVVVCSGLAGVGSEAALAALDEGAVDVIEKPKLAVREFLEESAVLLVDAVRAAAMARPRRPPPSVAQEAGSPVPAALPVAQFPRGLRRTTEQIVAIGASTGGTEALREILEALPPDAPGVVVVQHMPEHFTRAFAQRLNGLCRIEVKEAVDGDRAGVGRALIAPGNRHLTLARSGAQYMVRVEAGPLVSRHRPSVDVLFGSVARVAGVNATGVILTGMGDDGARGLLEMRQAGAFTIAQDEATSIVFGMPHAAIERGAVESVLPLGRIARALTVARHGLA